MNKMAKMGEKWFLKCVPQPERILTTHSSSCFSPRLDGRMMDRWEADGRMKK